MELFKQEIILIINEEVKKATEDMKINLNKPGSELESSIKSSVEESGGLIEGEIEQNHYGQFLDKGVTGANEPDFKGKSKLVHTSLANFKFSSNSSFSSGNTFRNKIDEWMSSKGINGGVDANNNNISKESINFLIRRSIKQHGIKGSLYTTNALEELNERIMDRLSTIKIEELIDIKNNINI